MIISRLILRNWRNFRSVDVPLTDRVFVVGPNASGKSNLLDAVRFLRDVAKSGGGLQSAIEKRHGLSKIRCLAARKDPAVEIEVELSEDGETPAWRYALGVIQRQRQPIIQYERVWRGAEKVLDRPDRYDQDDEMRRTQTHLEQISANASFREIARLFESVRYLHLVPQALKHPEAFQPGQLAEDYFGRSFLEVVAKTPEKTRRSRLRKIEALLREAVPQLRDLTDARDEAGVPHLEAVYEHWRPNAGRQREDQFSDGTLRLIGLFWALLDGDAPLLLEEPELSLHTAIVSLLPRLIYRLQRQRKRQIFMSTHSVDLLSDKGIGGEEVLMLTPDPEGTRVQVASEIAEVRALLEEDLSIADIAIPRTRPKTLKQMSLF
jgi:predicted ATPase